MARVVRRLLVLTIVLGLATRPFAAPQEPSSSTPNQIHRISTAAVVVDAVVRDGKGRPIADLRKEDFELFEDGVRQEIGALTVVAPATASDHAAGVVVETPAAGGGAGSASAPAAGPSFLAIVFDRLTPEARALAYKAALAYLETLQPNDFVGIFLSDATLTTIQAYTNDRAKLQAALRDVASRATSVFDRTALRNDVRQRDSRGNLLPGDAHPSVDVVASAESVGRPVDNRLEGREFQALELVTHNSFEAMARDEQGYATTNALLALTTGLGTLPGRKSVVFFAEGLSIPDAVLPHFRNVIANANRGNVSVYTIDAAGLRVHSKDAEIGREIRAMAAASLTGGGSVAMLERNEDVLRKDPRTSLTLLAQQTGGFLVDSTNDLSRGFKQIDADRRFHYLLTYTPQNGELDGKWRTITVKVIGRRVNIRARSGYLAVRTSMTAPLLAYEGPALAALERSPAPVDLPVRALALVFPEGTESRVAVLVSTDSSAVHFAQDTKAEGYRTDFTMLARIVDAHGDVIRSASQSYRLTIPAQQLDAAKRGEVLFFRQPILGPGRYTLEAAVHDAAVQRSGVSRLGFVVPAHTPQSLQVSSLVIVSRTERVTPGERNPDNPLYVGDVIIYPNLGESLSKSRQKILMWHAVVVPTSGTAPESSLDILRANVVVAHAMVSLASTDASGRIRHIGQVSIEGLVPGRYTLRLIVRQGDRTEVRESAFDVAG